MRNPDDHPQAHSVALLLADELTSTYAQLDHLSALVDALYRGVCDLIQALTPLPEVPGLNPVAVEHLRLALQSAREALHMADEYVEERHYAD